jgi:predicted  nucleic acid-binding Zn-ribbon protein
MKEHYWVANMGDVMPNYELERARIELEVSQLKHNMQSQKYRIMEIEDEKNRLAENITATEKSIIEKEDQLKNIKVPQNV